MESIRVFGLSRLDSLDLKRKFPDADITFEQGATADPEHGELATAAIVALSLAGIKALASWLAKNRKKGRIEKVIEIVNADGSRRSEKVVIDINESTSDADVVKQFAAMANVDLAKLA